MLTFAYDDAGNRTRVEDSKGGITTIVFDAMNRQKREEVGGTGVSAMRFDYEYTDRGDVEFVTRYADLGGTSLVATTAYEYDDARRLVQLTHTAGTMVLANYTDKGSGSSVVALLAYRISTHSTPSGKNTRCAWCRVKGVERAVAVLPACSNSRHFPRS